ncbi:MAG: NAD-dependent epimerase/dehydratase [Solirubrobacterales bacterium]|nr:NAD-dependent epimerase/dehydratase [Solirubrobacterales bacterium]
MRILVTGASGFAGSLLVPRLRADGHAVRALARQPARVEEALARLPRGSEKGGSPLDVVRGDVLTGAGLARALDDVEVAYYLIHSMERSAEGSAPFAERERIAAEKFAEAAAHAGVRRIVYLGGLLPRWSDGASMRSRARSSRHLASRAAVERILLESVPDSVALRASIVIGAQSRSFRLLVHLVERMPILTLPAWQAFRTQPIDARDVTEMLLAAADAPLGGSSLEIAGPDVLTYGQMMAGIAELMLVNRPSIRLGVNLTGITARVAAAIAGEDPDLVMPLMEGLQGDLLPEDDDAAQLLNVPLHNFESAVENALRDWERREPLAAR